MSTEPEFVAETLAWCNEQRKERGKRALRRLPKGRQADPASCPCGKATGLRVTWTYNDRGRREYYATDPAVTTKRERIPYPKPVQEFVKAFDAGKLPQYDIEAKA